VAAPVEVSKEVVVVAEPVVEEVVIVEKDEPAFRVTKFGMWTENDNTAGHADGDIGLTYLASDIGLASASGNWTYGVQAYKAWTLDSDEGVLDGEDNERFQLDAWRHFNREEDFKYSLGTRARLQNNYDRYYLRGKYSYGFVSGWVDLMYQSNNGTSNGRDEQKVEVMPLNMTFGPLTLGYFFYGMKNTGENPTGERTPETLEHQLRAYFPLFAAGKFSSDVELRLGLKKDNKAGDRNSKAESDYDFGDLQRYALATKYAYSDRLTLSASYLYEIVKYSTDKRDNYYGEFVAGWDYKF
ncbi:MAG: hypothetical protein RSB50_10045, partial [Cetobacterium sp.]